MVLLAACVLLFVPAILILAAPLRWLKFLVPVGVLTFWGFWFWLMHFVRMNDPGPAGIVILGYVAWMWKLAELAIVIRIIRSLWKASA